MNKSSFLRNYFKKVASFSGKQQPFVVKIVEQSRRLGDHCFLKLLSLLLVFFALTNSGTAQNYDGYTLYFPQGGTKAYLTDMSGSTYHMWTFSSSSTTTYATYLLPGGILLRTVNHAGNYFNGGPISGEVQKVDWNGTVLWDYVYSTQNYCSHHDIHAMPNGNVLLIAYERKTAAEVIQAGCSQGIEMWPDKIVEIQPSGTNGGTVVWEWHAWDHLVQHYDATKNNYGVVASHPELLNINYNTSKDWMHMNGIDYNAELDQIVFSSHALNEIYVIDHSTTTAQAASHTGGNSGKGGDFLYRWGNPAAYETAGTVDFNVVHDAHWVPSDNPSFPDALCGYNNKGGANGKTCVDIINPPYNGYNYSLTPGTAYAPTTYAWRHTYSGSVQQDNGSSQQLPNGNTLLCMGMSGFIYEINPSQTQVWSKSTGGTIAQAFRYPPCYVNGSYSATATATSTAICSGNSTQLNVTATGGAVYTYAWTSNPAGFTSNLQNPIVSPTVTTTYSVTITNGPCSATSSVTVTVNNSPTVTVSATPSSICSGSSSQLNAAVSGGTTYTYSWTSDPPGFTSTIQNPVVSPTVNTTYTVAVTSNGCTTTSSTDVAVLSVSATAAPSQICAGSSSQLDAIASGGTSYTYAWTSVPAGFTSTLQNPIVTPSVTTTYYVTVSSGTCSANSSATVSIVNPLSVSATAMPASICPGESSQLNAVATGGTSYTYAWTSVPAGFTSTLQNPIVTPSVTTTYYVTASSGNCSASSSATVSVTNPLSVTATALPADICPGESSQLNATATGATSFSYSWTSIPAGFTSTLQNPIVTPSVTTTYYVTASSGNCSASNSVTVTIAYPLSVSASATPADICYGESSQLNASVSGGSNYSYLWTSNPSGFTSTLQNPTVTPDVTTAYTVMVTSGICSVSSSTTIYVTGPLVIAANAVPAEICSGEATQLNVVASGGTTYSYAWTSIPAGFNSSQQNPIAYPTVATTYIVNINSYPCSAIDSVSVIVNPLPETPMITRSGDTLFSSASSGNQWYLNGLALPNATGQFLIPQTGGYYQVQVIDANNCKSTLSIPYLFTRLSEKSEADNLQIFPNPTSCILTVEGIVKNDLIEISVFSLSGKLLNKYENIKTIDISGLSNGVYFLKVMVAGQNIAMKKIVVIKN